VGWIEDLLKKFSRFGIVGIIFAIILIAVIVWLILHAGANPVCGNEICQNEENCSSCPADCGACTPTIYCGDGICNSNETNMTCVQDCPIIPPTCRNESSSCTIDNNSCCAGLVPVSMSIPSGSGCVAANCGTICRPCGDGICQNNENNCSCPSDCLVNVSTCHQNITVANWNLQIFGTTKANNDTLLNMYASLIDDYDIVFVQEIRDSSGTAFPKLCAKLLNYNCQNSSRAGTSSSKEQYGVIYKKWINITYFHDFNPQYNNSFERPPLEVTFNTGCYNITAYNIHTKPENVPNELTNLQGIATNEGNVMLLGDFNADCSYYNHAAQTQFSAWHWIIPDEADTTVAATNCAYDRIILNDNAFTKYNSYGIVNSITPDESDHYLVWAKYTI
jgi:endonuclease/exonuclease/phosphatase family metal-dependent hydrolase